MRLRALTSCAVAALALVAPLALATPADARPAPATGCAQVEAIGVRGTTEAQGGGSIAGPQATSIQSASTQTVLVHNLVYPASLSPTYQTSVSRGVTALRARLTQEAAACPTKTYVLIGYSQGAQVIADTLAAGNVPGAARVQVVVLFGDPTFNASESYNAGSYLRGRNGIFGRRAGALSAFASTIRSYCNATDNFCQAGAYGAGHYLYASNRSAATSFTLGKIGG